MLREALAQFGAAPAESAFVGDQIDDLEAAFHAGCRGVLVRTGLGRKTAADAIHAWLNPVTVVDDLAAAVAMELGPTVRGANAAVCRCPSLPVGNSQVL